jgi:hypothetical protein
MGCERGACIGQIQWRRSSVEMKTKTKSQVTTGYPGRVRVTRLTIGSCSGLNIQPD